MLFIIFFFFFFFLWPSKERERKKELPRCRYEILCKNIQYPLVRQLMKYCTRAVFRYAFRETNLPRAGGFHGIFDRYGDCVRDSSVLDSTKVLITGRTSPTGSFDN